MIQKEGEEKEKHFLNYFKVIDFFIKEEEKRVVENDRPENKWISFTNRQICKGIYGMSIDIVQDNTRELCIFGILELDPKSKPNKNWYYINKKLDFKWFKEIAKIYLDKDYLDKYYEPKKRERKKYKYEECVELVKKAYEDRLIFLEYFAQDYIDNAFVNKVSKNLKIPFSDPFYKKTFFPLIFSCFPSVLYEALFHHNEILEQFKKKKEKISKNAEKKMFDDFILSIQLAIYNDLRNSKYLFPYWWIKMEFIPITNIYFEYPENLNKLTPNELMELCEKYKISSIKNKPELMKLLKLKLKDAKIIKVMNDPLVLSSDYTIKFKDPIKKLEHIALDETYNGIYIITDDQFKKYYKTYVQK